MVDDAKLSIFRQDVGMRDSSRAYTVIVDEIKVGQLWNSDSFGLDLTPGQHTLRLKLDWTGSPTLEFRVTAGQRVAFACAAGSAVLAPIDLLRSFLKKRDRWITLRPSD